MTALKLIKKLYKFIRDDLSTLNYAARDPSRTMVSRMELLDFLHKIEDQLITEDAKKRALKEVGKMDIETTSEGKSTLKAHFNYWFKKLKGVN